jgi:hypothetical protein
LDPGIVDVLLLVSFSSGWGRDSQVEKKVSLLACGCVDADL